MITDYPNYPNDQQSKIQFARAFCMPQVQFAFEFESERLVEWPNGNLVTVLSPN